MKNRIYLKGIEKGVPFYPTCKEVIYAHFAGNEILDDFFKRNLTTVRALFKDRLGYDFIYIPEVVNEYADLQTLRYYHPLTKAPSDETIRKVNTELINSHLHDDDAKALAPGLLHFMMTECFTCDDDRHKGCYEYSYYPLSGKDDADIMASLERYTRVCGESYCHINYGSFSMKDYSEADRSFYRAQQRYFDMVKEKDISGIKRYVIDALCDSCNEISRVHVTADGDIILTDFNNMKIEMAPVVKVIYLLFLRHPEGIVFSDLSNYEREALNLYRRFGNDDIEETDILKEALNPDSDMIGQFCGEIYVKFREHLDKRMVAPYIIQAAPYNFGYDNRSPYTSIGEPKKILINRPLVTWDNILL